MLSSMLVAIDTTIANVALPHIQATVGASQEQIVWVLTSYLIASAIATPLSGWVATRFGRKRVMTSSIAGFVLASLLCGLSNSLPLLVIARAIQGVSGAGLVPLSQAALLDNTPPAQHPRAMAIFGLGAMFGPLIGPTLGGYLTDALSWRWVFFVNLPLGLLALLGLMTFMGETKDPHPTRFDVFGFATVSIALAAFQLVLDRGQQLDWFDSKEVVLEAVVLVVAGYYAVVHMFTGRDTFIRPELFGDRNFALGCVLSAIVGVVAFATLPMITVMIQQLLGYTAFQTGLISAPRGIGTIISMFTVSQLVGKIDTRYFLIAGLSLLSLGQAMYTQIDLEVSQRALVVAGLVQGCGAGLLFVPLSTIVFATLAPRFRNEGAAIYALTRNIGASLGISYLQSSIIKNGARAHSRLVEWIRPDNPVLAARQPDFDFQSPAALAQNNGLVTRQAMMLSYIDMFWFVAVLACIMIPMVIMMRTPRRQAEPVELPMFD